MPACGGILDKTGPNLGQSDSFNLAGSHATSAATGKGVFSLGQTSEVTVKSKLGPRTHPTSRLNRDVTFPELAIQTPLVSLLDTRDVYQSF
jgi:hypothetical protein